MMCTRYIVKRTQIYLEERQDVAIAKRAAADGVTKSTVIRKAIDAYLESPDDKAASLERFREGVRASFGTAPYLLRVRSTSRSCVGSTPSGRPSSSIAGVREARSGRDGPP